MDPDKVVRLVTALKLSSSPNKDPPITFEADSLLIGEQRIGRCLVAKVFSSKAVNHEAFVNQIPRILQATKHIEIGVLGDNLFLLDFKSIQDKKRALYGGPWNLFRDLIIFREPSGMQTPNMMSFTEISIWIQCYNLPLIFLHKDFLEKLGNHLGVVEEIDTKENGFAMGRYARVKVRIDISKPLKQHIRLSLASDEDEVFVIFSYERLPDFCYNCGIIGHSFRNCDVDPQEKGKLNYISWLKAVQRGGGRVKSRQSSPPNTW
ncbi:uncharacterized protein [Primulina eburnea]|uniref:uncharacterized protein n=1 Tax=Primulina eburnea TaxID=1245227 RepID=UPI003C6CA862